MVQGRPYLSKSRLISAWQCAKKLHLEKHHNELAVVTSQMESLFAGGHQVGDIAQQLYGSDESVEIAFDFKTMLAETRRLIEGGADYPIFEATFRHENVLELVAKAREAVSGPMPFIDVGAHCKKPYECQFISHCWPMDAEPEVLPGAKEILAALPYPRYYLDFETIGPAIPIWAGTRPYAAVPIQWSCHIEEASSELRHEEFLDLSGDPPMRALAEQMIECLGDSGPVLMYTSYEKGVITRLIEMFPDLDVPLERIINRLIDLHPIVKQHYYHPKMLGSWSIKAVLPCIAPHMDYSKLEGIKEGTAASDGYLEAINPETDAVRKAELEEQLLRYCKFDTEAMVEIVRFF
jgi:hypothetical protein